MKVASSSRIRWRMSASGRASSTHSLTEHCTNPTWQLNEFTRAALLANDLPVYLWLEVYMAMWHTQNSVPSSALQRG